MDFQKVKPKRFAPKSFKHSQDGRYWKKFDAVYAKMEKGFLTESVSFCRPQNLFALSEIEDGTKNRQILENAEALATATSVRVDLWKLR